MLNMFGFLFNNVPTIIVIKHKYYDEEMKYNISLFN